MQPDMLKPTACVRRKPSKTYKSPTATEWTTYAPCPSLRPKASSQTPTPPPTRTGSTTRTLTKCLNRSRQFTLQLLPLYHPQGQLACSLPPLDPLSFGLDAPINEPESNITCSSSRHVRQKSPLPPAATTDGGVQAPAAFIAATTVGAVAAVAAREIREKEKPSPSKRRTGGGGGKRKRKDKDASDATYPAKRTRAPRNTTAPPVIEEESQNELEANGLEDENNEAEKPTLERARTTRSRAGLKRQSSVNTTTSDTPSKGLSPAPPDAAEGPSVHHNVEMKTPTPDAYHVETPTSQGPPPVANTKETMRTASSSQEEKEEGELSDDGQ